MLAVEYSISEFVDDIRHICAQSADERIILKRLRPLALRTALSKDAWLTNDMYDADPEQGFGVHLLHEEPDHTLAVFAVSWLPGRGTPPHDHGTWGVVAGVDGPETNEFFARVDDGSRADYVELRQIATKIFTPGDVLAMPSGTIHRVRNESDAVTLSLHVYGKHINYTGRSQFDLEKRTRLPIILKVDESSTAYEVK